MRYVSAWVLAAATLCGVAPADEGKKGKERQSLGKMADDIAIDVRDYLGSKNAKIVALGEVKYTGKLNASTATAFKQAIVEGLARAAVTLDPAADFSVAVSYVEAEEGKANEERQLVNTTATVSKKGEEDYPISYAITNPQSVAVLLGLSVELPADADKVKRGQLLKAAADAAAAGKRTFALGSSVVRKAKDSPFGLEIRTAPPKAKGEAHTDDEYKVANPVSRDGAAAVTIKRDDVYGVVLVNDADFDAGVQLRIDGLSMFSFSDTPFRSKDGRPLYTHLIVPAKSRAFVRGWHVTNEKSDEFLVTEYSKSEAGKQLLNDAAVGTITAIFHAAWDPKGNPPADEPKNPDENSLSADATGRGTEFKQKYVEVERKVGVARAVVSVRYAK